MNRLMFTAALSVALAVGLPADAQDKVTFPSTDADLKGGTATAITGYLYKPDGAGPFPAVVGMHGCNGLVGQDGKVISLYGAWGERLSKEGYLVLLPDSFGSRGHGDLCGFQPSKNRPVKNDREMPRDAYGALAYLQSRPDVRPSVAILGQSFGAGTVAAVIAEGARLSGVAPEKDFRAAVTFYPLCSVILSREPKWAPRAPLLFLMGEADNFTPPAPCKTLLERVRSGGTAVESHFYPGAFHAFDHPNLPERVLTNVKLPPDGHSPTVGSNPEARADALAKIKALLATKLR
jgi:dienelactone hydrolase